MGWTYLSIAKLQRCNRWSFGMDKWINPTLYWACAYISMLGLKSIHVSKRAPEWSEWSLGRVWWKVSEESRNPITNKILNPMTLHYSDVIIGAMASQIPSLTFVYSTVYSDADQRKHKSTAALAFVRGIHRWPVKSPHKWPVTRKMPSFGDVIM